MNIARLLGCEGRAGTGGERCLATDRAPHVVGHQQPTGEEEDPAQQPD
eukprot:gene16359-20901_t